MPCFFSSSSSFFRSVWNSLAAEASAGRCSLTQRVKSIAAAGGRKLGLLLWTEWLKKKNMTVSCGRAEGRETVVWFLIHLNLHPSHVL